MCYAVLCCIAVCCTVVLNYVKREPHDLFMKNAKHLITQVISHAYFTVCVCVYVSYAIIEIVRCTRNENLMSLFTLTPSLFEPTIRYFTAYPFNHVYIFVCVSLSESSAVVRRHSLTPNDFFGNDLLCVLCMRL